MSRILLAGPDGPVTLADRGGPTVVALPGDDIALHRITLGQAGRRARSDELAMKVADLAAGDPAALHVATSAPDADGAVWVAVMAQERMEEALATVAAAGIEADALVPAALLLPEPEAGELVAAASEPLVLLRGTELAAAVEPELVPHLAEGARVPMPRPLAELLRATPPGSIPLLDLRQGRFAPPVRWWTSRRWQAAAALLLFLALLLACVPLLLSSVREQRITDAYDQGTVALAARTLERPFGSAAEAAAALALARRTAEGSGIAPRLSFATARLESLPAARLDTIDQPEAGPLTLGLAGPADAINQAAAMLAEGPFESSQEGTRVTLGAPRRPPPGAATPPGAIEAEARFVAARADAGFLAMSAARPVRAAPLGERIGQRLEAAGLAEVPEAEADGGLLLIIPAVRSRVLLPLLADLEADGIRLSGLAIRRNPDETLFARFTARESPR
jgi:general secretion pathway protein L